MEPCLKMWFFQLSMFLDSIRPFSTIQPVDLRKLPVDLRKLPVDLRKLKAIYGSSLWPKYLGMLGNLWKQTLA
jgi:hypothetical protein